MSYNALDNQSMAVTFLEQLSLELADITATIEYEQATSPLSDEDIENSLEDFYAFRATINKLRDVLKVYIGAARP